MEALDSLITCSICAPKVVNVVAFKIVEAFSITSVEATGGPEEQQQNRSTHD
jgi:hypothetical protein